MTTSQEHLKPYLDLIALSRAFREREASGTSMLTREYWVNKAKDWAEARLSPPQVDEFCAVMNELLADSKKLHDAIDGVFSDKEDGVK